MVYKFGLMGQNTKGSGWIMLLMGKENFGTLMEMSMMEIGKMIKLMDLVHIRT